MHTHKLSIVLIDDHVLLLESLTCILESFDFIKEVTSFTNAAEYLSNQSAKEPDIIVTDIIMPDINGIELLTKLTNKNSNVKVILLTCITEIQTIRHAMRNGAKGYLTKNTSIEEFKEALLAVQNEEIYVSECLRKKLVFDSLAEDNFLYNLSPRQKEVLKYVCKGNTIKETATEMQLSANTVQTYYKSILKKFNLNRTTDLIVFAIQNGLYNPQSENGR